MANFLTLQLNTFAEEEGNPSFCLKLCPSRTTSERRLDTLPSQLISDSWNDLSLITGKSVSPELINTENSPGGPLMPNHPSHKCFLTVWVI